MHDQARLLLDTFPIGPDGSLRCRLREARKAAPQLVGLLERWPGTKDSELFLPPQLTDELHAIWALLSPPVEKGGLEEVRRKSIGDRAEVYSYQFERLSATVATAIVWVARDDDTLGYDLEDRSANPRRRIEVKGSGGSEIRFFMSDNEWRKAHDNPGSYEIHFWGRIDLNRPVADEYNELRRLGYPVVFPNIPNLRADGVLDAQPERWRIISNGPDLLAGPT